MLRWYHTRHQHSTATILHEWVKFPDRRGFSPALQTYHRLQPQTPMWGSKPANPAHGPSGCHLSQFETDCVTVSDAVRCNPCFFDPRRVNEIRVLALCCRMKFWLSLISSPYHHRSTARNTFASTIDFSLAAPAVLQPPLLVEIAQSTTNYTLRLWP